MSESPKQSPDNLDLSNVPNEDVEQLASAIETFYKNDTTAKSRLTYQWERNHMMLDGQQWITFDGNQATGGVWKPVSVSAENEFIPRPVTNYMFDAYQTLKSYVLKTKPHSSVRPNDQTNKMKTAAKLADMCLEANYERLKEDYNYEFAAANCIAYGTVFKKSYWDVTTLSMAEVPKMQVVPTVDPMTGQVTGQTEQPVMDEFGTPVMEQLPLGDVNTSVIEPYRIALDPMASDIHTTRWIMEYSVQPIDYVKETYGKQAPGYTGEAANLEEETQLSNSMRRWWQLKQSAGTKGILGNGTVSSNGSENLLNSVVVKEYYERPTTMNPKGRLIVVANNKALYVGESPSEGPEQGDWHPYSEFRWELVPGRFWGKSPLDAGAEIQKKINSIDAVIALTRKTQAIPQKLIPKGSGVTPGMWTGRPAQEIYYHDTGGAKPEIIPASGVHESVFVERRLALDDFKQITGAIDILKGDRPPGVTAASALNMLYEVGTGKLFPVLDRWKKFIESDQKKQLRLIGQKYREPRPEFIKLLKSRNEELSDEQINQFIGTDLYDNFNVIIEAGSNIPKLQAAEKAQLMEAAATGALKLENPLNSDEFLRRLGIIGFNSDIGDDQKRAEWENDIIDNLVNDPDNKPVVLDIDNHDVHIQCHSSYMKQPAFMSKPIQVQQAIMQHIAEHKNMKSEAEQQQAMQAAMLGQPPQPQANPNQPQRLQKTDSKPPQEVQKALAQDTLVPGRVGGR